MDTEEPIWAMFTTDMDMAEPNAPRPCTLRTEPILTNPRMLSADPNVNAPYADSPPAYVYDRTDNEEPSDIEFNRDARALPSTLPAPESVEPRRMKARSDIELLEIMVLTQEAEFEREKKLRTLIDELSEVKESTEQSAAILVVPGFSPNDRLEPMRMKARNEILLPTVVVLQTESLAPHLASERTLSEEPRWSQSRALASAPNRSLPGRERADPILAAVRIDMVDAMAKPCSTLMLSLNRLKWRTESEDPHADL